MAPPKVQIKRTTTPNNPPTGLLPGELAVEMSSPVRLWVGVPDFIDPLERRLLSVNVVIADTPPVPTPGMLWWESDTGILWIFYQDADSAQWVQATGSGSPSAAAMEQMQEEIAALKADVAALKGA